MEVIKKLPIESYNFYISEYRYSNKIKLLKYSNELKIKVETVTLILSFLTAKLYVNIFCIKCNYGCLKRSNLINLSSNLQISSS